MIRAFATFTWAPTTKELAREASSLYLSQTCYLQERLLLRWLRLS